MKPYPFSSIVVSTVLAWFGTASCTAGTSVDLVGPFVPGTGHWTIVPNGDFEYARFGGAGAGLDNFTAYPLDSMGAHLGDAAPSTNAAAAGQYGMAIYPGIDSGINSFDKTVEFRPLDPITLVPGRTYVMSAFIRISGPIHTNAATDTPVQLQAGWQYNYISSSTSEWQFLYATVPTDGSSGVTDSISPQLYVTGRLEPDGPVYIDELAITPLEEFRPPELVKNPIQAVAKAAVADGTVSGISISNPGNGYPFAPSVLIDGGGGSGAQALAIATNGIVERIVVTKSGSNYVSAPSVYITGPVQVPKVEIENIGTPEHPQVKVISFLPFPNIPCKLQYSTDLQTWVDGPVLNGSSIVALPFEPSPSGQYFRLYR